jgi:hypothetical protein
VELKPQGASQQKKNRDNEVVSNGQINDESSIINAATDRWAIEQSETEGLNGRGTSVFEICRSSQQAMVAFNGAPDGHRKGCVRRKWQAPPERPSFCARASAPGCRRRGNGEFDERAAFGRARVSTRGW